MLDSILTLIGFPDRLVRASRSDDAERFVATLGNWSVSFLGAMDDPGLDPSELTPDLLLESIKANNVDNLAARQQFYPFTYRSDSQTRLPVFSNKKFATQFCRWYTMEHNRIFYFQLLTAPGSSLAGAIPSDAILVLNDRSKSEYLVPASVATLFQQSG